jgi:hypothetical protein
LVFSALVGSPGSLSSYQCWSTQRRLGPNAMTSF